MRLIAPCLLACLLLVGCGPPRTFVEGPSGKWISIEVRDDLVGDKAWERVADTLIEKFEIDEMNRESGYIRTHYMYNWNGKQVTNYRVRATANFIDDNKTCKLKCEAEYGGPGKWRAGYDTEMLQTLKTDIMGKIGRTTR